MHKEIRGEKEIITFLGVQLPSPPPKSKVANFDILIAKNVFALIYHTAVYGR